MKAVVAVVIVVGSIAAILFVLARPTEPAALPDGASPLALRTQPPVWRIPGLSGGCSLAGLLPLRLVRDGQTLTFQTEDGGEVVPVVFPYGYSARLLDGRAELVFPDGRILASEGDVISGLMGASASNGDFLVCFDPATRLQVVGVKN